MSGIGKINGHANFIAINCLATELGERFCKCPHANEILKLLPCLTELNVGIEGPQVRIRSSNIDPLRATIDIPEYSFNSKEAIKGIAFEIFNVQNSVSLLNLVKESRLGQIGIDQYALGAEKIEYESLQSYYSLMKKCGKDWLLEEEDLKKISEQSDLFEEQTEEESLLLQEVTCHTDGTREDWIDQIQSHYCKLHPEDGRSCAVSKSDLCDFLTSPISNQATCARLSNAAETTKRFFRTQLCRVCPEIYEKPGRQCIDDTSS